MSDKQTSDTEHPSPVETKPFALLRRPICWFKGHVWMKIRRFDPHAKRVEPAWLCRRCGRSRWRPSGERSV